MGAGGGSHTLVPPGSRRRILTAGGEARAVAGAGGAPDIPGFVDLDQVDPILFDKTYYLGPKGKEYGKVYALLHKALAKANRAGVATLVMRGREYLVALKADEQLGILTVHTLHWADEIRDPREQIPDLPGRVKVAEREMKMAEQLIAALSTDWDPSAFRDTFQEKVATLIEAKKTGESVEKAEPPAKATGAVDLMEALRASVDRARSPKDTGAKAGSGGGKRRKAAPSAKKRVTSKKASLQSMTKAELYERAAAANLPGRSTMTHDQLAEALTTAGRSRAA